MAQITAQNVVGLKEVYRLKIEDFGTFQAGVIYLTNSHNTLTVDATTSAAQWRREVARLSFGENGKPSLVIYALAENAAAVAGAAAGRGHAGR